VLAGIQPLIITEGTGGEKILPSQLPRHILPAVCNKKKRRILDMAIQDTIEDYQNYILESGSRRDSLISPAPGRWTRYIYPSHSRVTRYTVTDSKSDARTSSIRPIPFDSRIRERSPPSMNRFAVSVPNISRSTLRSAHHESRGDRTHNKGDPGLVRVPYPRHSGRSGSLTHDDYFSHSTSRHRDSDSSLERPVTTSHGTSNRRRREKG